MINSPVRSALASSSRASACRRAATRHGLGKAAVGTRTDHFFTPSLIWSIESHRSGFDGWRRLSDPGAMFNFGRTWPAGLTWTVPPPSAFSEQVAPAGSPSQPPRGYHLWVAGRGSGLVPWVRTIENGLGRSWYEDPGCAVRHRLRYRLRRGVFPVRTSGGVVRLGNRVRRNGRQLLYRLRADARWCADRRRVGLRHRLRLLRRGRLALQPAPQTLRSEVSGGQPALDEFSAADPRSRACPRRDSMDPQKLTIPQLQARKGKERFTMLTAYDAPMARLVDDAGIDVILVGDSLGMVMLGYAGTAPVTMDEMIHHAAAVGRTAKCAVLVGDLPFMAY